MPSIDILIKWIVNLVALCMLITSLLGFGISILHFIKFKLHKLIYFFLLVCSNFTLVNNVIFYKQWYLKYPGLIFLPIYFSLSVGPLFFFYTKARLYPNFRLKASDFKHFILASVQFIFFIYLFVLKLENKKVMLDRFFSPIFGNLEDLIFIFITMMYIYFSYRFVLHERGRLQKSKGTKREIFILGWLKRHIKVVAVLFAIHASFILSNYLGFKLLDINLNNKTIFNAMIELSFCTVVFWMNLNAIFAYRRNL
jgi:hypothetical protein